MDCNCEHEHEGHEHGDGCADCASHGECGEGGCGGRVITLSHRQCELLRALAEVPYLPLARFIVRSSQSDHLESVAMAPVYLGHSDEPVEQVRKTAEELSGLEELGLVSLDYGEALGGYDYEDYTNSSAFLVLEDMVREGASREGFLFDEAQLERGSMALTVMGLNAVAQLEAAGK